MNEVVDGYCERTGVGLWAEPLNAFTNLAFIVAAAVLAYRLQRVGRPVPVRLAVIPVLVGVVGVCSTAFHTTATVWAGALDSLSILVFILVYLVTLVHDVWDVRWRYAWPAAPVFLAFTVVFFPGAVGGYASALAGLAVLTVLLGHSRERRAYAVRLGVATVVFALSLTLRTVDGPWCAEVPVGTHFLWHVLNAVVLHTVADVLRVRWIDTRT